MASWFSNTRALFRIVTNILQSLSLRCYLSFPPLFFYCSNWYSSLFTAVIRKLLVLCSNWPAPPGELGLHLGVVFYLLLFSYSACPTLYGPMDCSTQVPLSFSISQTLLRFVSVESLMLSNHLILCHPLLLPPVFPNIRVFSNWKKWNPWIRHRLTHTPGSLASRHDHWLRYVQ